MRRQNIYKKYQRVWEKLLLNLHELKTKDDGNVNFIAAIRLHECIIYDLSIEIKLQKNEFIAF